MDVESSNETGKGECVSGFTDKSWDEEARR